MFSRLFRQRSFWAVTLFWIGLSVGGWLLGASSARLIWAWLALTVLLVEIGIVALLTWKRPAIDLAARAPQRTLALQELAGLWVYGAAVLVAGRIIGLHYFGEGIALHLNGSLVGATRVQSPAEVSTWAAYNGVLLALVPYLVFRWRGYSNFELNLRSSNLKNDVLVIAVILAISIGLDLTGPNLLQLTPHQQLVGGALTFILHLFGTDLPIMIFIYSILLPRYAKLCSPLTTFFLGAVSYPTMHIFESWARYDSPSHAALSLILVYLTFFPPGLMKSFLTIRTGNAWVHVWAFHAISPHVTLDTRLMVHDFNIK